MKATKPSYFLFENVTMGGKLEDDRNRITSDLAQLGGVMYKLNSDVWCAQNRERLYWMNVPYDGALSAHSFPTTMQEIVGDGYEGVMHTQKRNLGFKPKESLSDFA